MSYQQNSSAESLYRQALRAQLEPQFPGSFDELGYDACGIIANIRKTGEATHGNVMRTLDALTQMAHRSGEVRGEGDGCGIMTDIPRGLWKRYLEEAKMDGLQADSSAFFVGHFFLPQGKNPRELLDALRVLAGKWGLTIALERTGQTYPTALGPIAKITEPQFVQVAGLVKGDTYRERNNNLFNVALQLEKTHPVHVVSLSTAQVVYKVRGSAEILPRYYPELNLPDFLSRATLGHNRYSTNTLSTFEQVQPFSMLAHNGEINTIDRLRREGRQLDIPLTGGSDSQDLDRVMSGYYFDHGLSLLEALESVFPPVLSEVRSFSAPLQEAYMGLRSAGGPLAQGPAALITRQGNELVFSVDALGLRPLWFGETEKEYYCSSERGVIPLGTMVSDPVPFAPGEKLVVMMCEGGVSGKGNKVELHFNERVQRLVLERVHARDAHMNGAQQHLTGPDFVSPDSDIPEFSKATKAAFGWDKWDEGYMDSLAKKGVEPISSLGFDGQMAALREEKPNLAEFFKETVAVVTNPAIDREREIEHFSTRTVVGSRGLPGKPSGHEVQLVTPILAPTSSLASLHKTVTLEGLKQNFKTTVLIPNLLKNESLSDALKRFTSSGVTALKAGAEVLIVDDSSLYQNGEAAIDLVLALGALDKALTETRSGEEINVSLRRFGSVVVRSAQLRNLHDVMLALGLGAEAVEPVLMYSLVTDEAARDNLMGGLRKGIEKVMSTMGIHELRGYGHIFFSIGLKNDLAEAIGVSSAWGGDTLGYGLSELEDTLKGRLMKFVDGSETLERDVRFNPRLFKAAFALANGEIEAGDYAARVKALEDEMPLSVRQQLELKIPDGVNALEPDEVDLSVGGHSLPFVISAMSFGSQGETAFRSYVEAAKRLNIVSMNGEGGEIPGMMGHFNHWRGQQVASGRFGVSSRMLNSAGFIEIKVGQGAKPGEGGHLPGKKVTEKVAAARHAVRGVDLISPSNNHDVYSIEDLAQLIEELKTINPNARISVKIPVVPGVGTIALGVAKAGAHIITLSGFEGGTGAARMHALKYAGMPVEYGVSRAHRMLVAAGIRDKVELWADGGLKTALDVARMVALGANRVGFGTLSMVAIGCTICRGCQLDTCHVGIATQVETQEQAEAHGMKRWVPRELPREVERLHTFFSSIAEELRGILAARGLSSLSELRGRLDLLEYTGEGLDMSSMLAPIEEPAGWGRIGRRTIHKPLNYMTKMVSEWVSEVLEEDEIVYRDGPVASSERALGTHLVGTLTRRSGKHTGARRVKLHFGDGSIPGNGLGAFNADPVEILVDGGAQDGVGKSSFGGRITILKGRNHQGVRVDGSVGKSFAYGAIGGRFLIQGSADSRFCVRLSGADVILGGELRVPVDDSLGMLATRANAKGYAFEYMTGGRAVVVGDPGPWICSGMSGGVVYLRYAPKLGMDDAALKRRLAQGSSVVILPLTAQGGADIRDLLGDYHRALVSSEQPDAARRIAELLVDPSSHFRMVVPAAQTVDQTVATE